MVKGKNHENDQPHEDGQQRDQNAVEADILDLEKEGGTQANDGADENHGHITPGRLVLAASNRSRRVWISRL